MGKKKPTCQCIDDINGGLESRGYRLDLAFTMRGDIFPQIQIERLEGKRSRIRRPLVPASFCPFCGTKYETGVPR